MLLVQVGSRINTQQRSGPFAQKSSAELYQSTVLMREVAGVSSSIEVLEDLGRNANLYIFN